MFQRFFAQSDLLFWPILGLAIFFLTFLGVLAYVFFGMKKGRTLDRIASLPLEDDQPGSADGGDGRVS